MKIIFFGASKLGYRVCEKIIADGFDVSAIFTLEENFSIKYKSDQEKTDVKNVLYHDFSCLSSFGTPVYKTSGKIDQYRELIEKLQPDLIVVAGWYHILPRSILRLPTLGSVGLHASLLPKYRGNAPLVWAMINGEKMTGVSMFYFTDEIDAGDIISQEAFPIEIGENIADILIKAEQASINLISQNLPLLESGSANITKQDEGSATYFPRRSPADGLIDWSWENVRIKNFIRAQTKPYPGAFTYINGKKVVIWDADITDSEDLG